jgi:ferredoxin
MTKYTIEVDKGVCVGCGACAATCDEGFEMADTPDGSKAKPKKAETDELLCMEEAANICPVNAIHIKNNESNEKII